MKDNLYNKILGIPPEITNPNYYELLGLVLFEENPRKVHRAGLKCLRKLKDWQLHPDAGISKKVQEIMNQVGTACTVLELPEKKDEYDRHLAAKLGIDAPSLTPTADIPHGAIPQKGDSIGDIRIIGLDERRVEKAQKVAPGAHRNVFEMQKHLKNCPNCNAQLSELAQICIDCGYSFTLDKVLKTNLRSRVSDGIGDFIRNSGKAVLYIILLLVIAGGGYGGYYFYKEYGINYFDCKYEISNSAMKDSVRRTVRDSSVWKLDCKLAADSGRSRPYFTLSTSMSGGKFTFKVNGKDSSPAGELQFTLKAVPTPAGMVSHTEFAGIQILREQIKSKPESLITAAEFFPAFSQKEKLDILKLFESGEKGDGLEKQLFFLEKVLPLEKDEKVIAEIKRLEAVVKAAIVLHENAAKLAAANKNKISLMTYFKYLSHGSKPEMAAAINAILNQPLRSESRKHFGLLEIVIQSDKRSIDARCMAAWLLAGFNGTKLHSEALDLLSKVKDNAPEKLLKYIKFADHTFLYKLTDAGLVIPGTGLVMVPVLTGTPTDSSLLDAPFLISKYEITGKQYGTSTKDAVSKPAVKVNWFDAVLCSRRLNELVEGRHLLMAGQELRLPTVQEFMMARSAPQVGSLTQPGALAGDQMREWCLDFVKINKLGEVEEPEAGTVNTQGQANMVAGLLPGGRHGTSPVYPWESGVDLGFRIVMGPEIKFKSSYLDKLMGKVVPVDKTAGVDLFVLDNIKVLQGNIPLDLLLERGFAWSAPVAAKDIIKEQDEKTYKAAGVQVFRFPNLGKTRIIWNGGRKFAWKALFKFSNGQEAVRRGTGMATFEFDIVQPQKEAYVVMQVKGLLDPVYTDYVSYKVIEGDVKPLAAGRRVFDKDGDYLSELIMMAENYLKNDNPEKAYCLLLNAKNFGSEMRQINKLLEKCPKPDFGALMTDDRSKFAEVVKASSSAYKGKIDLKHSDLEAAMLTDRDLVGDGLCFEGGEAGTSEPFFIFTADCKLTITDIKRIYGKPTAEFTADNGRKFYLYGRFFFCAVTGSNNLLVGRFDIKN